MGTAIGCLIVWLSGRAAHSPTVTKSMLTAAAGEAGRVGGASLAHAYTTNHVLRRVLLSLFIGLVIVGGVTLAPRL